MILPTRTGVYYDPQYVTADERRKQPKKLIKLANFRITEIVVQVTMRYNSIVNQVYEVYD